LSYDCTAYGASYVLEWQVRAQDVAGNWSDWSPLQTLYVDSEPPSFTGCPADIVVEAPPGATAMSVTWVEPVASDTIPGPVAVTQSHAPGDAFPLGTTAVTYTATDSAGNSASCAFAVTVGAACDLITPTGAAGFLDRGWPEDAEPPVIGELPLSAIYEVGEPIAGAFAVCTPAGVPVTGPIVLVFYRVAETGPDYDVRLPLLARFLYYDEASGGYRFVVDTVGLAPGLYDIRLGFQDSQVVWLRVELVPPPEE